VAASANLPALVCTLYWRRCNTAGVIAGVVGGTLLSIGMVLVSPNMTYPSILGLDHPLISLRNPGIVSIPVGFLLVIVFSLLTRSRLSESRWPEMAVRRETGMGIAEAVSH